jgi:hypothetical protein
MDKKDSFKFNPNLLFICGLIILPSVIFNSNILYKGIQTFILIVLFVIFRNRIKVIPIIILSLSILIFHLLIPNGPVLLYMAQFPITKGALILGFQRCLNILSLIFLSRSFIRRGISLPGQIGVIISRLFYYFEQILEIPFSLETKGVIQRIDLILIKLEEDETIKNDAFPKYEITLTQIIILGLISISFWMFFIVDRINMLI